jgi:hypothetical protein
MYATYLGGYSTDRRKVNNVGFILSTLRDGSL